MCGHVGVAGDLEFKDEGLIKRLLVYDVFRGPDSTGIAALSKGGDVKIAKIASHPLDLFDTGRFKDVLRGAGSKVLLGHNRLATKGAVNGVNAHPFQYDHIIGAHNGTLDRASWTALEELGGAKTDVDSQAIFQAIAKVGIEETVKVLQGAWALVWIDLSDNSLNFLRNKERPLWYAYNEKFDKVFWASEYPHIQAAIQTSPTAQEQSLFKNPEGFQFWKFKEDWLYRFNLDELIKGSTSRPKPRVKELKGKEPAPASNYTCGVDPFPQRNAITHHTKPHGTTKTTTDTSTGAIINIKDYQGTTKDPFAGFFDKEKFEKLAKYGCSWCGSDISYHDVGVTINDRFDSILCPDCSSHGKVNRIYLPADKMIA